MQGDSIPEKKNERFFETQHDKTFTHRFSVFGLYNENSNKAPAPVAGARNTGGEFEDSFSLWAAAWKRTRQPSGVAVSLDPLGLAGARNFADAGVSSRN
jgi:hypothetical protein